MSKERFVKEYLSPTMAATGCGIERIDYFGRDVARHIDGVLWCKEYREELVVWYKGGAHKVVNVSGDSLAAMVEDLYRQGVVY